ncbi:MAG TPA: hypothetical protein VFU79_04070 [Nitrososphaeraceae archaeon]|nr:hypothetical protein [Nitrososphaeraceae archaeon]
MIALIQCNTLIRLVLIVGILFFLVSLIPTWNNKVYAHIPSTIPNAIFKEKDGYNIAFLPYPAQPKVNDNSTLLNFNVQKDGNDVTNTFISLIIMDKTSNKIVYQVPYKFYEFSDITYPYTFKNQSTYSLSLLTKVAGDPKYENNPLIENFEMEVSNGSNQLLVTIIFFVIFFFIMMFIIFPKFGKHVGAFLKRSF